MKATEIQNTVEMEATEIQTPEMQELNPQNSQTVQIPEKLNQQQALQVLVDAARIAQSKGIFTLDDAELVNKAIKAFVAPTGPVPSNG
jgi:hypothetical protein